MPEIVYHHFFSERVLDNLPNEVRSRIELNTYRIGSRGPDPLGLTRFWFLPVWRREHRKSNEMHTRHSGAFFRALGEAAREAEGERKRLLFSYLCGFLTHYFLDACCHPYVISCTGLGEGTSGNHRSLEHALDRDLLAEHGMSRTERPIIRRILPTPKLPEELREPLDKACISVYHWKDPWKTLRHALKDEKRFLRLFEDSRGHLFRLISLLSRNGTLRSLSYAEEAYGDADIWNEGHRRWKHPYDPEIGSDRSLREMEEQALDKAVKTAVGLWEYIFGHGSYPEKLIGDFSYESGFDWNDPRSYNPPRYELLPR